MELVEIMDEQVSAKFGSQMDHQSKSVVSFDNAELRAGLTFGQGLHLVVSGPAPQRRGAVRLLPMLGDSNPDYRKIQLVVDAVSSASEHAANRSERYEKSIPLSGLSGAKGIELIGSNGTKKFDLMA